MKKVIFGTIAAAVVATSVAAAPTTVFDDIQQSIASLTRYTIGAITANTNGIESNTQSILNLNTKLDRTTQYFVTYADIQRVDLRIDALEDENRELKTALCSFAPYDFC